jgi:hypothetical protein
MAPLQELLTKDMPKANNHREHIEKYNSAMVFTSIGTEIKSPPGNGIYVSQIQGHIYHFVSLLHPNEASMPRH